jgi:hypothetical protein
MAGPDDRLVKRPATWRDEGGTLVIRPEGGGAELHIIDHSGTRLVVQKKTRRD